jgi:hypothetical protein
MECTARAPAREISSLKETRDIKTRAVACQYNPSGQVIHFFFADAHFTDAHLRLQHALLLPERSR